MQTAVKIFLICILCLISAGVLYFLSVLLWNTFTEFKPQPTEDVVMQGTGPEVIDANEVLKLLTWNIGYMGLGKEMDFFYEGGQMVQPTPELNEKYSKGIIRFLEGRTYYDFILLQEVDTESKRSFGQNQVEMVAEILPAHSITSAVNYKAAFVPVPPLQPMGKVNAGLVTCSGFRHIHSFRYSAPGHYSWPKRLFMLKRCFLVSRFEVSNGKELVLVHLHNSAFDDACGQRAAELDMLRSLVIKEYENGNYVIAGGDWNQNPPQSDMSEIKKYRTREVWPIEEGLFPEDWSWAYDANVPTNRDVDTPFESGFTATTILDFWLLSPNLESLEIVTYDLGFEFSDHNPVGLTVKLRPSTQH